MKNSNKTIAASKSIASIATTNIQIGAREVVSIAVSRIETSVKNQIKVIKEQDTAARKELSIIQKKIGKLVEKQAVELVRPVTSLAEQMILMNKALKLELNCNLNVLTEDGVCSDPDIGVQVVTGLEIRVSVGLEAKSESRYCGSTTLTIFQAVTAANEEVTAAHHESVVKQIEIDELGAQYSKLAKDLSQLPSAERQMMARMAEKALSGSEGGLAMLAEVNNAIKAMGFGDLPSLIESK